ncbi:neutral zinc metallopeptidase [Acrocarpospora sp. B8E8]|uniref:neutral zinc metallopeptidase n=1 Tax=Acrocarpospora sp. B8E8 TaxID=3153572 RepID=UPI00325D2EFD
MRFFPLVAACALSLPLFSGTANAYPVKDRTLTHNKLYRSGLITPTECAFDPIHQRNNVPASKVYVQSLLKCFNTIWADHAKKARLPFAKARVAFTLKPQRFCGSAWEAGTAARYCYRERRFMVLLDKSALNDPWSLDLMHTVAHEYGHHVQHLGGMIKASHGLPSRGRSELNEQSRRLELQAECLSGALISSIWTSAKRFPNDWENLLGTAQSGGDEYHKVHDHGKGRNIAYWLDRGFQSLSLSECNTWTASSSKVA